MKYHIRTKNFCFLLLIAALILTMIIGSEQLRAGSYQICYSRYMLDNGYSFKNVQVCSMKDKELEEKVNESLNSCFSLLSDTWFGTGRTRLNKLTIHCQTARYLSVEYVWDYLPSVDNGIYWHLCVTVDMNNGKLVYLDDLIDVNEAFAMLVKKGKILRTCENDDFLEMTAEEVTQLINEWISEEDTDYIQDCFMQFTQGYLYGDRMEYGETRLYENYFYLEDDAICFRDPRSIGSIWPGSEIIKIMIKDIKSYLKVPNWTPAGYSGSRKDNRDNVPENSMEVYLWFDIIFDNTDLPYVSERTYNVVKRAYAKIDFEGAYSKGETETYNYYKMKFLALVQNQLTIIDKKTDEEMYLDEFLTMPFMFNEVNNVYAYTYYFFDVNEDGVPELGIQVNEYRWVFFKYDLGLDKCIVWYQTDNSAAECFGSRKFAEHCKNEGKFRFYQLDSNGEIKCSVFFFVVSDYGQEEPLYVIMAPVYEDKKQKPNITKKMKEQGIYEKSSGNWYFRVTKEQYEEIGKAYFEAEHMGQEKIQEVTYTYEELFDEGISNDYAPQIRNDSGNYGLFQLDSTRQKRYEKWLNDNDLPEEEIVQNQCKFAIERHDNPSGTGWLNKGIKTKGTIEYNGQTINYDNRESLYYDE